MRLYWKWLDWGWIKNTAEAEDSFDRYLVPSVVTIFGGLAGIMSLGMPLDLAAGWTAFPAIATGVGVGATPGVSLMTIIPWLRRRHYAFGLNSTECEILDRFHSLNSTSREQFPEFENIFFRMVKDKQLTKRRKGDRYPYREQWVRTTEGEKIWQALGKVKGAEENKARQIARQEAEDRLQAIEADLNAFVERAEQEAQIIG